MQREFGSNFDVRLSNFIAVCAVIVSVITLMTTIRFNNWQISDSEYDKRPVEVVVKYPVQSPTIDLGVKPAEKAGGRRRKDPASNQDVADQRANMVDDQLPPAQFDNEINQPDLRLKRSAQEVIGSVLESTDRARSIPDEFAYERQSFRRASGSVLDGLEIASK